jgi:hypothetical protein
MKEIKISQNNIAIVDDEDYDELIKYKYYSYPSNTTVYAKRKKSGKTKSMHSDILKINKKVFIYHIDGNGLNNQKSNLTLIRPMIFTI